MIILIRYRFCTLSQRRLLMDHSAKNAMPHSQTEWPQTWKPICSPSIQKHLRKFYVSNSIFKVIVCKRFCLGSNTLKSESVVQKKTGSKTLADVLFTKPQKRKRSDKEQQDYWVSMLSLFVSSSTVHLDVVQDRNFQNFCSSLNPEVSLLFVSTLTSLFHHVFIVQDAKSSYTDLSHEAFLWQTDRGDEGSPELRP